MENTSPETGVQTTQTSLEILGCIYQLGGGTTQQLSEELGLANSTLHRHLVTLKRYGYVKRYGNTFQLGLKFIDLSDYVKSLWPLEAIHDAVSTLEDETEEEIDFFTHDRGRIITIHQRHRKYHDLMKYGEKEQSKEYHSRYYYMHTVAAGKAILAEFPDARIESIVDKWGLPPKTEHSITTKAELFENIATIRERGYAIEDEEYAVGLRTVGAAVKNPNGSVLGAFNVVGPVYRMDGVVLEEEIPKALETACAELESAIEDSDLIVRQQSLASD